MQTVQKEKFYGRKQKTHFRLLLWKKQKLSPEKTSKIVEKQSYTRSYPQYAQKRTTSVVHENRCQVRKYVLEFVIKSQIKGNGKMFCRETAFLDKRHKMPNLPVNIEKQPKERNY